LMAIAIASMGFALSSQAFAAQPDANAPPPEMGFFITSVGLGNGANLGGLAGADKHCQTLAAAVGAGNRTWRAYLSQTASGSTPAVNARDRIGAGPWYNAKGAIIAQNVADLHGDVQRDRNSINKEFALTEKGPPHNGRGAPPNQHDILPWSGSPVRGPPGHTDTTPCTNRSSRADG